jgi:LacI family transcriptional regulator
MTASRAINGEARVAPETKARVLRIAESMGYRPSYSARSLRSQTTRLIGFVAPNLMLPVHVEIIQGARDVVSAEGYRLFLQVDGDDDTVNRPFVSDGDLVIADAPDSPRLKAYRDPSRTVGLMGRTTIEGIDVCGSDLIKATLEAFQHLLEMGYRRLGLIQHIGNTFRHGRDEALLAAGVWNDP